MLRAGFQRCPQICRRVTDELLDELGHLLLRKGKELFYCCQQRDHDQLHGVVKCDLSDFLDIHVKQFAQRSVVGIGSLEHTEHHVPDISYGKVRGQRVKGCALAFLAVLEILLAGLEIDFDVPYADIRIIYHLHWKIETAYQTLKDRLQMENFTGTKPILLEQDIYSTIYVSNIAEDIARDIEQEQSDHLKNDYKHRMAVNRTLCIGLLKSDLIYILLEKDPKMQDELFQKLYDEISENIVPVRPDRHYHRTKGQLAGNYSNTHKRSY